MPSVNFDFFTLDELISLKSKTMRIDCDCVANCDEPIFFVKTFVCIFLEYKFNIQK